MLLGRPHPISGKMRYASATCVSTTMTMQTEPSSSKCRPTVILRGLSFYKVPCHRNGPMSIKGTRSPAHQENYRLEKKRRNTTHLPLSSSLLFHVARSQ